MYISFGEAALLGLLSLACLFLAGLGIWIFIRFVAHGGGKGNVG